MCLPAASCLSVNHRRTRKLYAIAGQPILDLDLTVKNRNTVLRLEHGQLPENRQISKIVKLCGIDFHVLMEYNTVSLKNNVFTTVLLHFFSMQSYAYRPV